MPKFYGLLWYPGVPVGRFNDSTTTKSTAHLTAVWRFFCVYSENPAKCRVFCLWVKYDRYILKAVIGHKSKFCLLHLYTVMPTGQCNIYTLSTHLKRNEHFV